MMWGLRVLALQGASVFAFVAPKGSKLVASQNRSFASTQALGATQYLLRYKYIPDVLEKRGPHREGHLDLAKKMVAEGTCLSGGPTGERDMEVPTGALLVFTDYDAAKRFVDGDPYVRNGIVTDHFIEEWNVVIQKE